MRDRGVTVILVTHFMDEAERLCDRLALINHGIVRALDTPEAIAAQAGGSRVRFVPRNRLTTRPCARYPVCTKSSGSSATLPSPVRAISRQRFISALAAIGVRVSEVEARAGNLEDAFLKLTQDDASTVEGVGET